MFSLVEEWGIGFVREKSVGFRELKCLDVNFSFGDLGEWVFFVFCGGWRSFGVGVWGGDFY